MSQVENLTTINDLDEHKIQLELVKLIMDVRYDKPAKLLLDAFQNITLSSGLSVETREEILRGDTGWQRNFCRDIIIDTLLGINPSEGVSRRLVKEIMRNTTVTLSVQDTDHHRMGVMKPVARFDTKGGVVVFEHDNFITRDLLKYVYLVLVKSTNDMVDSIDAGKYAIQRLSHIGVDTVRVQLFNGNGIDILQHNQGGTIAHIINSNRSSSRVIKDILLSLAHDIEKYEVDF